MHLKLPQTSMATKPAVPVALTTMAAVSGCLFQFYGSGALYWPWILGWLGGGVALLSGLRRWRLAACFLGGGLLTVLHLQAPWLTYRAFLPRNECGAEVRAVIVEAVYAKGELPWLQAPYGMRAALRAVRVRGQRDWQACRGTVMLCQWPRRVFAYGTEVSADGAFLIPAAGSFPGDFSYRHYLRSQGIVHQFNANAVEVAGAVPGWRRGLAALYRFRDACLERVVRNLDSENDAGLLAAMSLGYRQGLSPMQKERFLRSGTIHIFAISGLHAGIVGALLLGTLAVLRVPFCWRYMALPPLLGFYVFMTGAAPSAVRAWTMFSVWAVTKARFRAVLPLNTVAVSALLLLAVNPLNLAAVGFQFSFVIVVVLILGWQLAAPYLAALGERSLWLPYRYRPTLGLQGLRKIFAQAFCASGFAWLGSAGLILRVNGLLIPASLAVNIIVSILMSATLALAFAKLAVCWVPVPGLDGVIAWALSRLLGMTQTLAELGSRAPGSVRVGHIGPATAACYYFLLFGMLIPWGRRTGRLACLLACLGILASSGCNRSPSPSPFLVTVQGNDCDRCPVAIFPGPGRDPVLINTGDRVLARCLVDLLNHQGVEQLEALILTERRSELEALLAGFRPRTVWMPAGGKAMAGLRKGLRSYMRSGGRVREIPVLAASRSKSEPAPSTGLEMVCMEKTAQGSVLKVCLTGEGPGLLVGYNRDRNRGTRVSVQRADGACLERLIPLAMATRVVEIPWHALQEGCEVREE